MEFIDLLDREVIAGIRFPNLATAQQVITRSAAQLGFALHLSSSSKQPYVRFHCYKGGKSSKTRQPNMCPCSYRVIRQEDYSYRFGKCEVAHNHELLPAAFADLLLSDEMREYVQELHRIGVSPLKIRLALEARGVQVSSGQIQNICKPGCLQAFTDSSAELINFVVSNGGSFCTYDERIREEYARVAVFTQMPEERNILSELGDVIEIDGTHAPLKTNWEIVPITVMDCGRHVHCGGIMFAAFVTTEVIHWLLGILLEICPSLNETWRVLITDEDSAFIPAVEARDFPFAHILCAMHKESNFLKKLNRCGLAKPQRERAARLFRQLAYSDHKGYANSCLEELERMGVPRLDKYIGKHIRPRLHQFAKSFLPSVFTCGLNTTSGAESMNRLLKVGMRPNLSLADARGWFTQRLSQHRNDLSYHRAHRRSLPLPLEETVGVLFEPEIRRKIQAGLDDVIDCEFREGSDANELLVHSRRLPDVAYVVVRDRESELHECNCGMTIRQGYPCVHILAVLARNNEPLRKEYFHPRWFANGTEAQGGDHQWTNDDMPSDDDIASINRDDDTEESLAEIHAWDIDQTIEQLPAMSQRSAYLTLFHFAKSVCTIASRDLHRTADVLRMLNAMRMNMMQVAPPVPPGVRQEALIATVHDAPPRVRGRPKNRQIPNAVVRAAKVRHGTELIVTCDLCEDVHELEKCPFYHLVLAARLANGPIVPRAGQRKCPVCWGYGHQRRTCPCRREAQVLTEQARPNDDE
jgi:hypothetical protein